MIILGAAILALVDTVHMYSKLSQKLKEKFRLSLMPFCQIYLLFVQGIVTIIIFVYHLDPNQLGLSLLITFIHLICLKC